MTRVLTLRLKFHEVCQNVVDPSEVALAFALEPFKNTRVKPHAHGYLPLAAERKSKASEMECENGA